MARDKSRGENTPGDDESGQHIPAGSEAFSSDPATGEPVEDGAFIEAEGPDVETSTEGGSTEGGLSDEDLSFLDAVSSGAADELAAERLADLQRITAEYANYRKRTEANREVERERTVGDVVKILLPVLDDLDRAEKHGDLAEGPFASIAGKLRVGVERLGLKPFGAVGEPFDPKEHEAIFQQPTPGVEVETIADVVETGYYLGSTLLRAAKVVVAVPNG
ncbi:nucleotide exchange factor GrpE [Subtercola boreus]|uniref:Protein GrpE n=1 Tax=Subtercola boreus TaxID=120213 RepID=A0A3E0W937_9MICO|nr:nucleotide exchange factor GrpE [Subtercola boreus]RFA18027.1 nucleotide exchange factor GrpE [Subtercola boreus]RFA18409.1 nucleotide exchange factor GrpE [Subtercola boreus]RFA24938.1 nucleotide exchange factor GrpE [Subtercola boreus]